MTMAPLRGRRGWERKVDAEVERQAADREAARGGPAGRGSGVGQSGTNTAGGPADRHGAGRRLPDLSGLPPLLAGSAFTPGAYRLVFAAGEYFRRRGTAVASPPFVDEVTLDFGVADSRAHYHVPLLVSPWSYSTYRGS